MLAGAGLAIGLAIALSVAGMIEKLLFGVAPLDTPTLAVAPLLLLTVACLSCVQPAWRASHADPAPTLRHD
jgi:ABC-type lipoprotein release transport system permease subunit